MTSLRQLSLDNNNLSGDLPHELGALTNLLTLYIAGNNLTGCMPAAWHYLNLFTRPPNPRPVNDFEQAGLLWCAPLDLAATAGERWVDLTWKAPTTGTAGNSLFHQYQIHYSNASDFSTGVLSKTLFKDNTSDTIRSLSPGTRFYFRIGYTTSSTQTAPTYWSRTVSAVPDGALFAPTVTLTRGDRQIAVSWVAPPHNTVSIPTAYDLRHRTRTGETTWSAWTEVQDAWETGDGALEYTMTGLTNGTEYDVRVRGVNTFGDGDWSGENTATPATLPDAPGNASATPTSNGEVTVAWDAPASDGGEAVSRYTVEYADNSAFTNSTTGDSTTTSLKTGQLTLGTEYHFRVRAVNAVGNSAWSATVTATPRKPPGAPTIDTA